MTKLSMLMILFESYIWNFPLLWEWGMAFSRPIALVADDRHVLERFIDRICLWPMRIYKTDGIPRLRCSVERSMDENTLAIFMDWERSSDRNQKEISKFEYLEQLAAGQKINQEQFIMPVFILSVGCVSDVLLDRVIVANLPSEEDFDFFEVKNLIPDFADFQGIRDRLYGYRDHDQTERVFAAAALMLAPKLEKQGKEEILDELLLLAETLSDDAEGYDVSEEIVKSFSQRMLSLAESGFFDHSIPLPDLSMDICKSLEEHIFVRDRQELYLSEKKFKELVENMDIPLNYLKNILRECRLLKSSPGGYTTKMSYTTCAGTDERHRMICINIDRVRIETVDGEVCELSYFID